MKYRKKPVVIDAVQWFRMGDHPAVMDYHQAWDKGYRNADPAKAGLATVDSGLTGKGIIQTLEGWHEVTPGDWVITGVKGEHYPCKPEIFAMTYDTALSTPEASHE
jgi:hypothetical protein